LFSILIRKGKTEDILFNYNLHIFAPEFLFEEFNKYAALILGKTGRNKEEFEELVRIIKKKIKTVPNEETEKYINKAGKISPDKNDIDYFALALKLKCPIWSNDKELKKQEKITVYSTEDLIKTLKF